MKPAKHRQPSRTAVYVTRMHGGVGGGDREVPPYPDRLLTTARFLGFRPSKRRPRSGRPEANSA
jgi:hypothetical protein